MVVSKTNLVKIKSRLVNKKNLKKSKNMLFEKQRRIMEDRKILKLIDEKLYGRRYNPGDLRFLAQENLITEFFISRLRKQTKRPIVVVALEDTGMPYVWSLMEKQNLEKQNIYVKKIRWSSTGQNYCYPNIKTQKALLNNILNIKLRNPLFVFVDSSKRRKMPASFIGLPYGHASYKSITQSLASLLEKKSKNVEIIGSKYSTQTPYSTVFKLNESKKWHKMLGKSKSKEENIPKSVKKIKVSEKMPKIENVDNLDCILFNPSRDRKTVKKDGGLWTSAAHDDVPLITNDPNVKKIVLYFTKKMRWEK